MLTVFEGEKGDGGNSRSGYRIVAGSSVMGEERDNGDDCVPAAVASWLVSNEEEEGINYNGCGYISWRGSRGRKKVRTVGIGAAGWGARRKMRAVVGGSTTTGCGLEVAASRSG
ncbi:hypothetical protein GW17_00047206 [Ensete ventricosum]|nr:hypothetical protein GW17_00047206 [Ensete ventricosum]